MSQEVSTFDLDPSRAGFPLIKQSVAGHRVNFVETSNVIAGRITLQATGNGSLQDFGYFSISLSYSLNTKYYSWDKIVAWNYCDFFIDSASASSFISTDQYRIGSTAVSTRGKQSINIFKLNETTAVLPASHTCYYVCQNNDSSSHTVDAYTIWKYIITGDAAV